MPDCAKDRTWKLNASGLCLLCECGTDALAYYNRGCPYKRDADCARTLPCQSEPEAAEPDAAEIERIWRLVTDAARL